MFRSDSSVSHKWVKQHFEIHMQVFILKTRIEFLLSFFFNFLKLFTLRIGKQLAKSVCDSSTKLLYLDQYLLL